MASKDEVRSREATRPLDLDQPLDLKIRQEMDNLQFGLRLIGYSGRIEVYWTSRGSTLANPDLGIVLNRDELEAVIERVKAQYPAEAEDIAYLAAVAHETGHFMQYKHYGVEESLRYPGQVAELQADLMAGSWIASRVFNPNLQLLSPQQALELPQRMRRYITIVNEVFTALGELGDGGHGDAEKRDEAVAEGMVLGVSAYKMTLGLPVDQDYRQIDFHYGHEKMMEWSLRRAYKLSGIPEGTMDDDTPGRPMLSEGRESAASGLAGALRRIVGASRLFADVRGAQDGGDDDDAVYTASAPIPGGEETRVHIDRKDASQSFVSVTLFRSSEHDRDSGKQAQEQWAQRITNALPPGYNRTEQALRPPSPSHQNLGDVEWHSSSGRPVRLVLNDWKSGGVELTLFIDEQ